MVLIYFFFPPIFFFVGEIVDGTKDVGGDKITERCVFFFGFQKIYIKMCESAYNSPLPTRRLTESCCSSPARSIRSHNIEILSDSDGEFDDKDLATEIPGLPDQTVIAGWLKFRDNKKVNYNFPSINSIRRSMYFFPFGK